MIEEAIHSILANPPELDLYRTGGVFPALSPWKASGTILTYQQISENDPTQPESAIESRWQINVIGNSGYNSPNYRSGKTAARAVKLIMTGFRGELNDVCIEQIKFENQTDLSDSNTDTFFVAQDYLIKYFEA